MSGMALPSFHNYLSVAGKWTGIISTDSLTGATPASAFAVAASKGWHNDASIPDDVDQQKCPDIASQLIDDDYG